MPENRPDKLVWKEDKNGYERIVLAGDAGGTNTNIAIVGVKKGSFSILGSVTHKSAGISNFTSVIVNTIKELKSDKPQFLPDLCSISGAGPVKNNHCALTNTKWGISGNDIEKTSGIKTVLINDFMALSYGIPLLDINNPVQITKLPSPDGTFPEESGGRKAVVGAGTGLGVGYLTEQDKKYSAHPSEGGHSDFAAFDADTAALKEFIRSSIGMTPGTERVLSGQGIVNIFNYYKEIRRVPMEGILKQIDQSPDKEKPRIISANTGSSVICSEIFKLFVRIYGKFASSASVFLIPEGGIYIAGGIVTKNEKHFIEDNLFMKYFLTNHKPGIRKMLQTIPVYIVRNYSTSLLGAANAGIMITEG